MFKRSAKGFTLIELLVVIAIIGILSSVVLASLNDARRKSRDAKRIADIKQIQLAQELYFDDNGTYSATLAALAPTYIPSVPLGPLASETYFYDQLTSGTDYHVGADLETDHSVLDADSDTTSTNIVGAEDGNGCGTTGAAGRYCYDLNP